MNSLKSFGFNLVKTIANNKKLSRSRNLCTINLLRNCGNFLDSGHRISKYDNNNSKMYVFNVARAAHTKFEGDLVEFLTQEIIAERKSQKYQTIPTELRGFNINLDGAKVELVKQCEREKIIISFNVNHSLFPIEEMDITVKGQDKNNNIDLCEMRSRPNFAVDICRADIMLSLSCSFLEPSKATSPGDGRIFVIDQIYAYEKKWSEKTFTADGDLLDNYLCDLIMNLLEERGITNDFALQLSELATAYEHHLYIGLLENLSKFSIANTT